MSSSSLFPSSSDRSPEPDPARALSALLRDVSRHPPPPLTPLPPEPDEALRADPMASFEAESELAKRLRAAPQHTPRRWPRMLLLGLGVVICVTAAVLAAGYTIAHRSPAVTGTGQAQIDSRPSGVEVVVDGEPRGQTPLKLTLPVGEHTLEIQGPSGPRLLPITIRADVLMSHHIELPSARRATGRLEISSMPTGATVRVDGVVRGVTPLIIDPVEARRRSVTVSHSGASVSRSVTIAAGGTATLFMTLDGQAPMPGSIGGYITLNAPFDMQVFEEGRLIGTTSASRLMLPTGRHHLELVSPSLQYRTTMMLDVRAGQTTQAVVPVPNGAVSVNALPWADVFIDGRPVGTTPLADLTVPVGAHEIVWRHPELGERRENVTVTSAEPLRIGVDFSE